MKISRHFKKRSLRTRVIKRIEDVPAEEWNKIFPNVPEGYNFLKTLDESNFDQFTYLYILVYNRKELVGAAPCFTVDYSLDTSINGPLRRLTNSIKKIAPNIFSLKALVCGIPMGQGNIGIALNASDVLKAIEDRMESIARKIKAPIIAFKDFDDSYNDLLDPLTKKGFLKIDSLPNTEIKLNFNSIEDYIKTLSANSRSNLRRKFKKSSHVNIECTVVDALDEKTLKEAYALYLEVVETHDLGFEILPIDFFRNISRNIPDQAKYFLWKVDGELAAFMFCLVSDELFLNYFLGFNYEIANKHHLYFIKFRDTMNWCMERGIKRYEMGTTGYDGKRRLGFKFVPWYLYVKMRPRALRPALKILKSLLKFENFDPILKQWKRSQK